MIPILLRSLLLSPLRTNAQFPCKARLFLLLDYVTYRSEKLVFQKKKKKKGIIPDITAKLFLVSSQITDQIITLKHHSASVNYIKLRLKGSMSFSFFFAIAVLKNFSWFNEIQQIKKPSPNTSLLIFILYCLKYRRPCRDI